VTKLAVQKSLNLFTTVSSYTHAQKLVLAYTPLEHTGLNMNIHNKINTMWKRHRDGMPRWGG